MTRQTFLHPLLFLFVLAVAILPTHAQHLKPLHQFDGSIPGDGAFPHSPLLLDSAGNLFGTTLDGGTGDGTVFRIDSAGNESVLFAFDSAVSGAGPDSTLIEDKAGHLYGVAIEGGPGGGGVVFKLSPNGELTILHAFQIRNKTSPAVPAGGLLMDNEGNLFGTTYSGGNGNNLPNCPADCGTIFRVDPTGKFQLLYQFTGGVDGSQPFGPLLADANGALYGIARAGGDLTCPDPDLPGDGCGTVFKISRGGGLKVLHVFRGSRDGATPQPGLVFDSTGNLYGATLHGGISDQGLVYKITPDGTYTVVHRFVNKDGTSPNGSLVVDPDGDLWGTTNFGTFRHQGSIFRLSPDGEVTVLHRFVGELDGGVPQAGLIRSAHGNFFGTTTRNLRTQKLQGGSVFEFIP